MKVYESVYILLRYIESIETLMNVMLDHQYHQAMPATRKDQFHYLALFGHMLMETASFFDEYHEKFYQTAEQEYKQKIIDIKQIVKPAVGKIDQWKEIKKFRNEMIAHNWRDKAGNFIMPKLGTYNAPRSFQELMYLVTCLLLIRLVLLAEFGDELEKFVAYIEQTKKDFDPPVVDKDFEGVITGLVDEINAKLQTMERRYALDANSVLNGD